MNTNNYKNFNLEEALKNPYRVICRNGEKPSEWHYFETLEGDYKVRYVVDGVLESTTINGRFHVDGSRSMYDLFLLPETKTVFVNIYREGVASWYDTKEQALHYKGAACLSTIQVTI